jgi:hypothetical protein
MSNKNNKKNVAQVAKVEAVEATAPAVEVIESVATEAGTTEAPVAEVQEIIAAEAVTAPVVEKKAKNKPNETTRTIEAFADDTKGIRVGTPVMFKESSKPDAKMIPGKVQRVFDFYAKPERQEAKIKGENGNRYYRFEKDLTVIVPEAIVEEAAAIETEA